MGTGALFGRYRDVPSPIHRLDPRTKVLGTFVLVIVTFLAGSFPELIGLTVVYFGFFGLAKLSPLQAVRSIAPLLFIIVLTALFNLFFVQGGETYLDWGWLKVSAQGVTTAAFVSLRLLLLLMAGSLLTLTTTSLAITDGLEHLLKPLGRIGFPVHEFALILGLALRFLPQFTQEFRDIRAAQLARGARLATSPFRSGLSALSSLLVPLFTSVFRHADTLSAAMEARCYHGAAGRTQLHPLAFGYRDAIAAAVLITLLVLTALL